MKGNNMIIKADTATKTISNLKARHEGNIKAQLEELNIMLDTNSWLFFSDIDTELKLSLTHDNYLFKLRKARLNKVLRLCVEKKLIAESKTITVRVPKVKVKAYCGKHWAGCVFSCEHKKYGVDFLGDSRKEAIDRFKVGIADELVYGGFATKYDTIVIN